jgi:hypothetical protein
MGNSSSVCIVSCSATKGTAKTWAEDLYRSETFGLARRYAHAQADRWFIFSAKHGLLPPARCIEPYDQQISDMSRAELDGLVHRLKRQLDKWGLRDQSCVSLCDADYNSTLRSAGLQLIDCPVETMPKFAKIEWLRARTDPQKSEADLDAMYLAIRRLIAGHALKPLRELVRAEIPQSGVYLFFDFEEHRLRHPSELRIVRVGTHGVASGSRASLRDRLRTHLGTAAGGGNHRSSVFRLHVGRALMERGEAHRVDTWGSVSAPMTTRQRRSEERLEAKVSEYLGSLLVSVIDTPGDPSKDNDRAYLEQNLIGLISNGYRPLDPATHGWLGNDSDKTAIRRSGLWNVNHTNQAYHATFPRMLEYYVARTLGHPLGPKPAASAHWSADVRRDVRQMSLL